MKLTIERAKWLRGEGSAKSQLLRAYDGKMCCLGFLAIALGYTRSEILGLTSPADLACELHRVPAGMGWLINTGDDGEGFDDSTPSAALMGFNDDRHATEGEREAAIKAEFANQGIEVEFV